MAQSCNGSILVRNSYSYRFLIPAGLIYGTIFIVPTFLSFFFSLTRWSLSEWEYIGLDNFRMFFEERALRTAFLNTLIYAPATCLLKVVLGLLIAVLLNKNLKSKNFLKSVIFFPSVISTLAVGLIFSSLMHPTKGLINIALGVLGISGPDWLGNPGIVLFSVILVDVWKGIGVSMVIYIAGLQSIPAQYYDACKIDGGNKCHQFFNVTLPLVKPAMNSVIMLSLIGGLKTFGLVWAMTQGGPGFSSDLLASVIYKQYVNGYYGLSVAGNVILFVVVAAISFPLYSFLNRKEIGY